MALTISRTYVNLMTKAKRLTAEDRDRATRAVEEAIMLCRRQEASPSNLTASALNFAAQVYIMAGRPAEATAQADEAASILHSLRDDASEGYTLLVSARAHVQTGRVQRASSILARALACFERAEDADGESIVRSWQQSIGEAQLRSSREKEEGTEASEPASAPKEEKPALPAGSSAPTLDMDLVRSKVSQITSQIIGAKEPIDDDSPLLNVGLTSMSSAMLRDALARDFPESSLPFTLAFDYPSINAVAEYLVESTRVLD
mmetsp:Transcript_37174/g.66782  ORF Transcript_37174/g.66782 Transcript_37174/m.66782 type:complete len:261 (-) Transcript_37174:48-830(-)